MKTRRRLTLLGAMLAMLLGIGGQQAATADEVQDRRRGWGCVHVAGVKVGLCLYDPISLPTD